MASSKLAEDSIFQRFRTRSFRLPLLALLVFACFGTSAAIDEGFVALIATEGHRTGLSVFLTLVQFVAFMLPSVFTWLRQGARAVNANRWHVLCGVGICFAHGLVNVASTRITFASVVLFKSAKVPCILAAGFLVNGHQVTFRAALFSVLLCSGLCAFAFAEHGSAGSSTREQLTHSRYDTSGLIMATVGIFLGGVINQVQERLVTKQSKAGEVNFPVARQRGLCAKETLVLVQYAVACCCLWLLCALDGSLIDGFQFYRKLPAPRVAGQVVSTTLNSIGLRVVLSIVEDYGAVTCGVIVTLRKLVTFVASYVIFPKPFHWVHGFGVVLAMSGAVLLESEEQKRRERSKARPMWRHKLKDLSEDV